MTDAIISKVASWLDPVQPASPEPPAADWALVEIMGHRRHYGRITEMERFGAKMLRVDVPFSAAAPLLGEPEIFETFVYAGPAIFGITPMTEEACRKWAESDRPRPVERMARLPAPDYQEYDDDECPI
jgi:hypothetical protein